MKKIYDWFVYSSKNPAKISLTLKSIGGLVITISGLFSAGISTEEWDGITMAAVGIVSSVGVILSSAGFIYGLFRKIIMSRM